MLTSTSTTRNPLDQTHAITAGNTDPIISGLNIIAVRLPPNQSPSVCKKIH